MSEIFQNRNANKDDQQRPQRAKPRRAARPAKAATAARKPAAAKTKAPAKKADPEHKPAPAKAQAHHRPRPAQASARGAPKQPATVAAQDSAPKRDVETRFADRRKEAATKTQDGEAKTTNAPSCRRSPGFALRWKRPPWPRKRPNHRRPNQPAAGGGRASARRRSMEPRPRRRRRAAEDHSHQAADHRQGTGDRSSA